MTLFEGQKMYVGKRTADGCKVIVYTPQGEYPLDPRLDVRNHSPAGFEWGYAGSGPAQLALALCCDLLQDDLISEKIYMDVKFRLVGRLDKNGWQLTESELRAVLAEFICDLRRANPFSDN